MSENLLYQGQVFEMARLQFVSVADHLEIPWETKPRTALAGRRTHSGEVRALGAPCLSNCRPATRNAPLHHYDEDALTQAIVALALQYGRYGYRRIKSLLDEAGWDVGCDRVQQI